MELLERIRASDPGLPVVILTATKTVKTAVAAMKLGAFDYLTKPFDVDELRMIVERATRSAELEAEVKRLRHELRSQGSLRAIVGKSPQMQSVMRTVRTVAPLKTTVLITGESGTGKELVARALHFEGPRSEEPWVVLNCAAIPETLLEAELFGHERGAFTDAHARKIGLFEQAHRGTIFLDEIGEMSINLQAKLLRVLEEERFTRVGGTNSLQVSVRVVAATNRNLERAIQEGRFRADLYYRLNVIAMHLPTLRERNDDVPFLVTHFLDTKARELGAPIKHLSREAMDRVMSYSWPGNVRELENAIERAVVLCDGPRVEPRHLPSSLGASDPGAGEAPPRIPGTTIYDLERYAILKTLEGCKGSTSKAATILGISPRKIQYKLHEYASAPAPASERTEQDSEDEE
jgi:DNA-binding NtrC family response regulator